MSFDPEKSFNDLPLLPPKAEIETKATLKKAISANKALGELKGMGETIPNQAMLVNSIILQEAKASFEVEQRAFHTSDKILGIRDPLIKGAIFTKENLPSRVYSKDLIELLFHQPYTKTTFLVDNGIAERKTAADYLNELEDVGILERQKVGRENLYLNRGLFEILSR